MHLHQNSIDSNKPESAFRPSKGNYGIRAKLYHLEQNSEDDYAFYREKLAALPGPLLIVPSGTGRLLPVVHDRPNTVFMDLEPEMVRILNERLRAEGAKPTASVGDIQDLPRNRFRTIVVPAEAVQMFDPLDLIIVLRSIKNALIPRGVGFIDLATFNPGYGAPSYFDGRRQQEWWLSWSHRLTSGSVAQRYVRHLVLDDFIDFLFEYNIDDIGGRLLEQHIAEVRLWKYDDVSFRQACEKAGLHVNRSWTSYLPGPITNDYTRLIYEVCRD